MTAEPLPVIADEFHPLCTLFPLDEQAIADLIVSMQEHGYDESEPIIMFEGQILDGRHRYLAAKTADVTPVYEVFRGDDAKGFVVRRNLMRRHLSREQKKEVFFRLRAEGVWEKRPRGGDQTKPTNVGLPPSNQEIAERLGVDKRTVERWDQEREHPAPKPEIKSASKKAGEETEGLPITEPSVVAPTALASRVSPALALCHTVEQRPNESGEDWFQGLLDFGVTPEDAADLLPLLSGVISNLQELLAQLTDHSKTEPWHITENWGSDPIH